MQKKRAVKILAIALFAVAIAASAFFCELLSASGKIFSGNKDSQTPIAKQLSDMIINPSRSLRGEENEQVNVLLLGIGGEGHSGGQLTDTIMIASIKPQSHEAALLSIPRDLYVEVEGTDIKSKINAVKAFGDKSAQKNGIELLKKTVEDVSGLHMDYYVQLDFQGFTKIIDTVGGIDVYLENNIDDKTYPDSGYGYDPFYIEKGWHHLDGATALKVARSRHSAMGDFDRIKRQQEIIRAFRQKIYDKYSSTDILAFRDIFLSLSQNMKTDVELQELPRFYRIVKDIRSHNITAQTVDTQKYLQKVNVGLGYTLGAKSGNYGAINELGKSLFTSQIPENKKMAIAQEKALIAIENGTGSPDLANTISKDLENMGFRIVSSSNIAAPDFAGVKIEYPGTVQKPETLQFLAEKFSAETEVSNNRNSRADFTIILGKGF